MNLAQPFVDLINTQKVTIYFYGRIRYADEYWIAPNKVLGFCYWYDPKSVDPICFAGCNESNYTYAR